VRRTVKTVRRVEPIAVLAEQNGHQNGHSSELRAIDVSEQHAETAVSPESG
jgi:hypothetical protein